MLLKGLKSKDFALSMIFLNEKKITNIFLILVVGSLIFFIGDIYASYINYGSLSQQIISTYPSFTLEYILVNITRLFYSFVLLYFVYGLQNILNGENND